MVQFLWGIKFSLSNLSTKCKVLQSHSQLENVIEPKYKAQDYQLVSSGGFGSNTKSPVRRFVTLVELGANNK